MYAYVDENGDRGTSPRSSRFFSMAGIVVAREHDQAMRDAIDELRADLSVPRGAPLHWKDHVKVYPRRQLVAKRLAALRGLQVNYVVFEKASIPAASRLHGDTVAFYNYVAGLMMERLLLTAKNWDAYGPRTIKVRFGHVKGFGTHADTLAYLARKRADPGWVPWRLLDGEASFVSTGVSDGLQAADQYAGMLSSAIYADRYGGFEPHHLLRVRHQIRRHRGSCWNIGFKAMTNPGTLQALPWWPPEGM